MNCLAKSLCKNTAGDLNPVPPPRCLPVKGPAMWKKMPYDSKYPFPKVVLNEYEWVSKEIGEPLVESFPRKRFELSDAPLPPYHALHDPYLRQFYRSGENFSHLVRQGLVTTDGQVKMKLPELNSYRDYLYRVWGDHVKQLIREQDEEESKCFQKLTEAFQKGNSFCEDILEEGDDLEIHSFVTQLTLKLFEKDYSPLEKPLAKSLVEWNKFHDRLRKDYSEDYPVIRKWLEKQWKNKQLAEKYINHRLRTDTYLRRRWEKQNANSKFTYNKLMRIEEKQRLRLEMLSEKRLHKARKQWANFDVTARKRFSRSQEKLPPTQAIKGENLKIIKSFTLGPDWDLQTTDTQAKFQTEILLKSKLKSVNDQMATPVQKLENSQKFKWESEDPSEKAAKILQSIKAKIGIYRSEIVNKSAPITKIPLSDAFIEDKGIRDSECLKHKQSQTSPIPEQELYKFRSSFAIQPIRPRTYKRSATSGCQTDEKYLITQERGLKKSRSSESDVQWKLLKFFDSLPNVTDSNTYLNEESDSVRRKQFSGGLGKNEEPSLSKPSTDLDYKSVRNSETVLSDKLEGRRSDIYDEATKNLMRSYLRKRKKDKTTSKPSPKRNTETGKLEGIRSDIYDKATKNLVRSYIRKRKKDTTTSKPSPKRPSVKIESPGKTSDFLKKRISSKNYLEQREVKHVKSNKSETQDRKLSPKIPQISKSVSGTSKTSKSKASPTIKRYKSSSKDLSPRSSKLSVRNKSPSLERKLSTTASRDSSISLTERKRSSKPLSSPKGLKRPEHRTSSRLESTSQTTLKRLASRTDSKCKSPSPSHYFKSSKDSKSVSPKRKLSISRKVVRSSSKSPERRKSSKLERASPKTIKRKDSTISEKVRKSESLPKLLSSSSRLQPSENRKSKLLDSDSSLISGHSLVSQARDKSDSSILSSENFKSSEYEEAKSSKRKFSRTRKLELSDSISSERPERRKSPGSKSPIATLRKDSIIWKKDGKSESSSRVLPSPGGLKHSKLGKSPLPESKSSTKTLGLVSQTSDKSDSSLASLDSLEHSELWKSKPPKQKLSPISSVDRSNSILSESTILSKPTIRRNTYRNQTSIKPQSSASSSVGHKYPELRKSSIKRESEISRTDKPDSSSKDILSFSGIKQSSLKKPASVERKSLITTRSQSSTMSKLNSSVKDESPSPIKRSDSIIKKTTERKSLANSSVERSDLQSDKRKSSITTSTLPNRVEGKSNKLRKDLPSFGGPKSLERRNTISSGRKSTVTVPRRLSSASPQTVSDTKTTQRVSPYSKSMDLRKSIPTAARIPRKDESTVSPNIQTNQRELGPPALDVKQKSKEYVADRNDGDQLSIKVSPPEKTSIRYTWHTDKKTSGVKSESDEIDSSSGQGFLPEREFRNEEQPLKGEDETKTSDDSFTSSETLCERKENAENTRPVFKEICPWRKGFEEKDKLQLMRIQSRCEKDMLELDELWHKRLKSKILKSVLKRTHLDFKGPTPHEQTEYRSNRRFEKITHDQGESRMSIFKKMYDLRVNEISNEFSFHFLPEEKTTPSLQESQELQESDDQILKEMFQECYRERRKQTHKELYQLLYTQSDFSETAYASDEKNAQLDDTLAIDNKTLGYPTDYLSRYFPFIHRIQQLFRKYYGKSSSNESDESLKEDGEVDKLDSLKDRGKKIINVYGEAQEKQREDEQGRERFESFVAKEIEPPFCEKYLKEELLGEKEKPKFEYRRIDFQTTQSGTEFVPKYYESESELTESDVSLKEEKEIDKLHSLKDRDQKSINVYGKAQRKAREDEEQGRERLRSLGLEEMEHPLGEKYLKEELLGEEEKPKFGYHSVTFQTAQSGKEFLPKYHKDSKLNESDESLNEEKEIDKLHSLKDRDQKSINVYGKAQRKAREDEEQGRERLRSLGLEEMEHPLGEKYLKEELLGEKEKPKFGYHSVTFQTTQSGKELLPKYHKDSNKLKLTESDESLKEEKEVDKLDSMKDRDKKIINVDGKAQKKAEDEEQEILEGAGEVKTDLPFDQTYLKKDDFSEEKDADHRLRFYRDSVQIMQSKKKLSPIWSSKSNRMRMAGQSDQTQSSLDQIYFARLSFPKMTGITHLDPSDVLGESSENEDKTFSAAVIHELPESSSTDSVTSSEGNEELTSVSHELMDAVQTLMLTNPAVPKGVDEPLDVSFIPSFTDCRPRESDIFRPKLESIMKASIFELEGRENALTRSKEFIHKVPSIENVNPLTEEQMKNVRLNLGNYLSKMAVLRRPSEASLDRPEPFVSIDAEFMEMPSSVVSKKSFEERASAHSYSDDSEDYYFEEFESSEEDHSYESDQSQSTNISGDLPSYRNEVSGRFSNLQIPPIAKAESSKILKSTIGENDGTDVPTEPPADVIILPSPPANVEVLGVSGSLENAIMGVLNSDLVTRLFESEDMRMARQFLLSGRRGAIGGDDIKASIGEEEPRTSRLLITHPTNNQIEINLEEIFRHLINPPKTSLVGRILFAGGRIAWVPPGSVNPEASFADTGCSLLPSEDIECKQQGAENNEQEKTMKSALKNENNLKIQKRVRFNLIAEELGPECPSDSTKSMLTKDQILDILSNEEVGEVQPSQVLVPTSTVNKDKGSDSNFKKSPINIIESHIQRLDSYLRGERKNRFHRTKHEKKAMKKVFIKDNVLDKIQPSMQSESDDKD